MPLLCPECSGPIPAEDINIQEAIAKCSACASVFPLTLQADRPAPSPPRPLVAMPKGVTVSRTPSSVTLVRRWFTPAALFLVFFATAWDSFLIFWYSAAVGGGAPWIFKVFPIAHVAVGLGVSYLAAALLVNKTVFRADPQGISVRHGPLPWKGNMFLAKSQVAQLFCRPAPRKSNNASQQLPGFAVLAVSTDGRQFVLADNLEEDQARYVEQEIEACFGIEDRPVAGELGRS